MNDDMLKAAFHDIKVEQRCQDLRLETIEELMDQLIEKLGYCWDYETLELKKIKKKRKR